MFWTVLEQHLRTNYPRRLSDAPRIISPPCPIMSVLKALCVGVAVVLANSPFFAFFSFPIGAHMTLIWTVPEQHLRTKRCA